MTLLRKFQRRLSLSHRRAFSFYALDAVGGPCPEHPKTFPFFLSRDQNHDAFQNHAIDANQIELWPVARVANSKDQITDIVVCPPRRLLDHSTQFGQRVLVVILKNSTANNDLAIPVVSEPPSILQVFPGHP